MIASIFGKSKPINIIIVAAALILFFGGLGLSQINFSYPELGRLSVNLLIIIFSLFVLDFINSKNNLTLKNSYAVLFFGLIAALFPQILKHSDYLWSNLFILFAMRRLISLHSRKAIKKKLFDASFWITAAAILNPGTFLFIVLVVISVAYYSGNDIKTAVIPLIGITSVLVFKACYNIIFFDEYVLDSDFTFPVSWDFSPYFEPGSLLILIPFLGLIVWSITKLLLNLKDRATQMKPAYVLVFWMTVIAFMVSTLSMIKDGGELIYFITPSALVLALNLETLERPWLLNGVLTVLMILPIVQLFI